MTEDQEIRAAAIQAAAALYGQLAGGTHGASDNPATVSAAADRTEALAARFARYIKGDPNARTPTSWLRGQ
ncbi:hypothetical protein [Streptomyces cavernae]|uniref:hypothetical protein n=1 Tax=Streptomyces cavernae TaxID=2259034 RepID=UPI000FEBE4A5|nr:hypothetical protein [Streptomyces cavernae]